MPIILEEKDKSESASRRNIGLIAMAVAVIVGLSIYLAWPGGLSYRPLGQQQPSRPDIRSLPPQEQQKRVADIIATGDLNKCKEAKGIMINGYDYGAVCHDNIVENSAMERLDTAFCDKLADNSSDWVAACKKEVILKKLQKTNDLQVCQTASSDLRAECEALYWSRQALDLKESKPCENIVESKMRTWCRDRLSMEQLIADPDEIKCSQFIDTDLRRDCEVFRSTILAKSVSNVQSCQSINSQRMMIACRERLIR